MLVSRKCEFLWTLSIITAAFSSSIVTAKKCPSFCTESPKDCTSKGGKVVGYCTNNIPCCDLTDRKTPAGSSCGEKLGNDSSIFWFQSPNFPILGENDLICSLSFELQNDTVGIVLDFQYFYTDNVKYGSMSPTSSCDTDMFFIKGFNAWSPPPICGSLSKYKMVIDDTKLEEVKQITLHAVMSSPHHAWNIQVTQIHGKDWPDEKPVPEVTNDGKLVVNVTSSTDKMFRRDAYGEVTSAQENKNIVESPDSATMPLQEKQLTMTGLRPLIVNGVDSPLGKVPWQASLRINVIKIKSILGSRSGFVQSIQKEGCDPYEGVHYCGGTIIGDQEILTAAHCFYPSTRASGMMHIPVISVVLGDLNKCRDSKKINKTSSYIKSMFDHEFGNPSAKAYEVDSVVLHFAYEPFVVMNDIAIVRLKEKIVFNDEVKPIRLAKYGQDFTGKKAFASGWGRTNLSDMKNRGSHILQSSDNFKIHSKKKCKEHTVKTLMDSEAQISKNKKYKDIFKSTICITSWNKSVEVLVGEGDSGGPLVHFDEETSEPILIGVVSYGNPVKRGSGKTGFVDFFQSVAFYRNWIDTVLVALRLTK